MASTVWILGLFGGAAATLSLAVSALLRLPGLDRLHPRARARFLAWSALVPLVLAASLVAGIFVPHPWLGLPDHCLVHDGHLHLCMSCGLEAPPLAFTFLTALYAGWITLGLARVGRQLARAHRALRRLGHCPRKDDLTIVPGERPVAFVGGFLRPSVFVSAPVVERRWSAVLAHEQDHAAERDPLVRLLVRLALVFHPPGVAGWLDRRLVGAQELAADESAATAVGDRLEVARQVIAWARAARFSPHGALGFDHGDLGERVRVLVDPPRYLRGPTRTQTCAAAILVALAVASLSTSIHHGAEEVVDLLHALDA